MHLINKKYKNNFKCKLNNNLLNVKIQKAFFEKKFGAVKFW